MRHQEFPICEGEIFSPRIRSGAGSGKESRGYVEANLGERRDRLLQPESIHTSPRRGKCEWE
jgi:hypothetical protein